MRAVPTTTRAATALGAALDAAAVLVFVLAGRSSHAEHDTLAGVARTGWPFWAALALGWVLARAWRRPSAVRTGAVVWPVAVLGGHLLRLASGQGSAWSFLVVTALVLGALLVGWRALAAVVLRRRSARPAAAGPSATGTAPSR